VTFCFENYSCQAEHCFGASSGWLSRFKHRHDLVFKKLAGESAEISVKSTDAWQESLPSLLEGYKPRDV
jgi:hypothetical protein